MNLQSVRIQSFGGTYPSAGAPGNRYADCENTLRFILPFYLASA